MQERRDPWNFSLSSCSREKPSRDSENEQIRILLEQQKEQILADCGAESQRHEFQADSDRRNIQDSDRSETHAEPRPRSRLQPARTWRLESVIAEFDFEKRERERPPETTSGRILESRVDGGSTWENAETS